MLKRVTLILIFAAASLMAQEKTAPPATHAVYRLEYTISEVEGSKKQSHSYSILVMDGRDGRLRVGSKIPIPFGKEGQTQIQFMDVGVRIDATPRTADPGTVQLNTTFEVTAVATGGPGSSLPPVLRNLNNSLGVLVPLDKPVLLTSQDEPGSQTAFQVQVLVRAVK